MAVLDRLRLFEKALLPLVVMGSLFAITVGVGVFRLDRTVESYRVLLGRNGPAVLRIERLNALTDQVGYSVYRILNSHCLREDAARCAETARAFDADLAEGELRLDEAVRFDSDHRADYERFRLAFRAVG